MSTTTMTKSLCLPLLPRPPLLLRPHTLLLRRRVPPPLIIVSASASPRLSSSSSSSNSTPPPPSILPQTADLLSNSTRTVSSIFISILSVSHLFLKTLKSIATKIETTIATTSLSPEEFFMMESMQSTVLCSLGPLFFARRGGYYVTRDTPMRILAKGMAKWLDLYSGILFVRILLSWFPSIPWERQPFSALKDISDPFLNVFRQFLPPLFNMIDVSPILGFVAIGVISTILKG